MTDIETAKPRHSGVRIPPPAIYAAVFFAAVVLDRVQPLPLLGTRLLIPGAIVIAAAAGLAAWAVRTFWRAKTSIVPIRPSTSFVTDGPFRFTRNPMYVAFAAAYMGTALILNSIWPFLLFPLLIVLIDVLVIGREERYLETIFGSQYASYKSRVRRWI